MIDGALRLVAVLACAVVAAGFVAFAVDQLSGASQRQQAAITDSPGAPATAPETEHSGPRGAVDTASGRLLAPFAGVAPSSNPWVARGVPTLLAFAVYGVGLGFLARWLRSRS